ncbi:single-stranded-DNA-specific exonuclease RecJ [Roseospira marina]|uniref:Single-stranded-DNA-specific exonuclease RecJ n=1 Tax=Roseospira marina TaxID=140057 RepID=A0A5M6IGA1_9PROT|nr:single-stranded-DNA-specific exonuclease RecJ [Roseospira marina]KAA5607244.1 single-stranded-DNA-specific exonuclease RecJ [Roseospira marina]MBB4312604.1 single-stranded-DNA-specific exonuclease [Roseospira marina]MBB5085380.1 single-stranded-DNA-specific exonuclease [Roseospira marina]
MTTAEAAPPTGLFDDQRSVLGRRWRLRPVDERLALTLAQRHDLPDVVARLMASRGIDLDAAPGFLCPTMRDQLPDPSHLRDLDTAVARLVSAVQGGDTIALFGDYDVDGATSSALLMRYLRAVGAPPVRVHIPDRLEEGYGPNAPALLGLQEAGASVCVCVDCGMTAFEPLAAAREVGLDVVVVDHHAPGDRLPDAVAVINPKRRDESTPHRDLAAVGVTFLLTVGLNRALRAAGWFTAERPEPDLKGLLDLVALGTVCDVMPLTGLNRAFVTQGLKVMARRQNVGIAALADVAGLTEAPTAFHLGYILGPRVNAGGRVGEAPMGTRLLSTDDPDDARRMAEALDGFNADRKEIEAQVLLEALEQVEGRTTPLAGPMVLAAGEGWHPGVIGIVASRLRERFDLPACVLAIEGNQAKGSGRSIPGLDLGAAVIAAREAGILTLGGGHAMAAGFSLHPDRITDLEGFLSRHLADQVGDDGALDPVLDLDGALAVEGASLDLLGHLDHIAPFGAGNPEPAFVLTDARVLRADIVGMGHVRCQLGGSAGGRLKAIAFKVADGDLGQALLTGQGRTMHIAGTLRVDRWQGRTTPQFVIDDAILAG